MTHTLVILLAVALILYGLLWIARAVLTLTIIIMVIKESSLVNVQVKGVDTVMSKFMENHQVISKITAALNWITTFR